MEKNTELVKRTEVEGTPFTIITTPDGGSVITMGRYRVSEPMESITEAIEYVERKPWKLILSITLAMIQEEIALNQKPNDTINKQKNGKTKKS